MKLKRKRFHPGMNNILKALELTLFSIWGKTNTSPTSTLPRSVQSCKALGWFYYIFFNRIDWHYTFLHPPRCRGESGGHPGQQNVHLPPLLECSWSSSNEKEWELSWTLCYFLLTRSDTEEKYMILKEQCTSATLDHEIITNSNV